MNYAKRQIKGLIGIAKDKFTAIMIAHGFMTAMTVLSPAQYDELSAFRDEVIDNFKPEDVKNV